MTRMMEARTDGDLSLRRTHPFELLMGALLTVDVAFLVPFPFANVALLILIVIGLTRPAPLRFSPRLGAVPVLLIGALAYLAATSAVADFSPYAGDWIRRLIRLTIVVLGCLILATGRFHLPSITRGFALGLVANIGAFYLGLTRDDYGGVLTGFVGDKNAAGLMYAVGGVLLMGMTRTAPQRLILAAATAVPVWLTASRTSLMAYAAGLLWIWVISRRAPVVRWLAAGAVMMIVNYVEANFAQVGPFEARWGSDLLRERIESAVAHKLSSASWFGEGLGEAYVRIGTDNWYFHSSYDTLLIEGGWPLCIAIVGVTVWIGLIPFGNEDRGYPGMVSQGATVTLLICAWKLGEVFLTVPWVLLMALAIHATLTSNTLVGERAVAADPPPRQASAPPRRAIL